MASDITGGLVRIEDGIKKAEEYAPARKVVVELHFSNENGTDYRLLLEQASNAANAKVAELLGKDVRDASLAGTNVKPRKPPTPKSQEPAASPARPVADTPAVASVPAGAATDGGGAGPLPQFLDRAKADPADMGAQAIQTGGERNDPAAMTQADADVALMSAPKEVTDKELTTEIGKVNQATKNTPAIRKLIGEYCPQDGKVHQAAEIPQEKRAAFLIELAKVAKVG